MIAATGAPPRIDVLGTGIDAHGAGSIAAQIERWAAEREPTYVCFCNVHSLVTARRDPALARALAGAGAALPDGMPVAWVMRRCGAPRQPRLSGPDLMWQCCVRAAATATPVYLLGGDPVTLRRLEAALRSKLPSLIVAGSHPPPFRPLSDAENAAILARIRASGARLLFVGLGCPKQELWMARVKAALPCVALGVGAAFEFHAGMRRRAPVVLQRVGLEWLFRLACEPRRLWKRYFATNALFIWYLLRERPSKSTDHP